MLNRAKIVLFAVLSFVLTFYTFGATYAADNSVLSKTKVAAQEGRVINSEFGINSNKNKILKAYGKPDKENEAILDYLSSRQLAFSLNKKKVNAIYTIAKEYQGLTSDEVEKELGKPNCAEGGFGKVYWSYHLGKYLLTFQFRNEEVRTIEQVMVEKDRTCNEIK
jgi:hypothetical protein